MNPTPVVTTSTGPQQLSNQKQEILPEEFETQLAGYLKKEQPGTIHKKVSDSEETIEKENQDEESTEEPTDEILNLDTPLLYANLFSPRQEQQSADLNTKNEQLKIKANQLVGSTEIVFDNQLNVEFGKIASLVQNENPETINNLTQTEEHFVEPVTKEVTELQKNVTDLLIRDDELVENTHSKSAIVSEPVGKISGETLVKDVNNLILEESDLIQADIVLSPLKKETVMADTILSTGRFLTAEWRNGPTVNQPITEPDNATLNSLNELPKQINESLIDSVQQSETVINDSKLTVLTETLSTEKVLKDSASRMKNSESYEAVTKVTEVDTQGQPLQQQQIGEATSIKQPSVVEPVKQAGIQQISEVVMQQAETILSGKQSIAHVILTPERMGEVNITVELKDNVLITKIIVDTMETKDLLTNGMHQLTDKLDRQNIRLGDLTIQLNEQASSDFTSQERQNEEKKSTFGQQKANFTANEMETVKPEEIVETTTKRLSILV